MSKFLGALLLLVSLPASAGDLIAGVKMKLAAGDLASGIAAVEDYRRDHEVDAEYLGAVGWLARGAEMQGKTHLAEQYVAELHRLMPQEKEDLVVPYGAAIEVEGRLMRAREGRGASLRYFRSQLTAAKDPALRARINKNINLLSLEGEQAPRIRMTDYVGATPLTAEQTTGKPVLMYFWANWCGDCKSQAPSLARVWQKYRSKGLVLVAPTRYYGSVDQKPAAHEEEKARVAKVWSETYAGLDGVTAPIDDEGDIRYGASATPTFVLVDRQGIVRMYAPTRLSEEELSRQIERVLGE